MHAPRPNFYRPVVALLGLPIDVVSLQQAAQRLEAARAQRQRCFLSTPNLNFAVQSQSDPVFRDSVCRSDLSVADGMPLIWVARLLGLALRERVAGSNLFERLRQASEPWKVFFFGGQKGVAQQACLALNAQAGQGDMVPVGLIYPGFVGGSEMTRTDLQQCINDARPDVLVVSLGAVKGQAWISDNLRALDVPVVSHLGAVVNFVAGTVSRAPDWMQRCGLEWAWRIKEEPALWRRYAKDAAALARLLAQQVLPLALHQRVRQAMRRRWGTQPVAVVQSAQAPQRLALSGDLVGDRVGDFVADARAAASLDPVRDAMARACASREDVWLDLSRVRDFDATFVALLLLLDTAVRDDHRVLILTGCRASHKRVLRWHGAAHLLQR